MRRCEITFCGRTILVPPRPRTIVPPIIRINGDPIVLEYLLHFLVSITTITLDHRMCQVPLLDVRLFVHHEDDAAAEFLLVRTEGADEVAEAFREHGDGAVDEVDARGAVVTLLVDDGAFLDVVGDVSDMDADFPEILSRSVEGGGWSEITFCT